MHAGLQFEREGEADQAMGWGPIARRTASVSATRHAPAQAGVAASKQKGMWMGGLPPLGYNVEDRKLVVNGSEAATVRDIFRRAEA